jgi:hypothetical protein
MGPVGLLRAAGFIVDRCNRCLEPGTDLASRAANSPRGHLSDPCWARKPLLIIGLAVLTSLVLQVVLEFGPLCLVALATPAVLYGPYWAALTSTFGLGGLPAGRVQLNRMLPLAITVGLMILASLALTRQTGVLVVAIAQVVLRAELGPSSHELRFRKSACPAQSLECGFARARCPSSGGPGSPSRSRITGMCDASGASSVQLTSTAPGSAGNDLHGRLGLGAR